VTNTYESSLSSDEAVSIDTSTSDCSTLGDNLRSKESLEYYVMITQNSIYLERRPEKRSGIWNDGVGGSEVFSLFGVPAKGEEFNDVSLSNTLLSPINIRLLK
jgi:hypothetical protein